MPPTSKFVPAEEIRLNRIKVPQTSELIELEAKVMKCQVELAALKLFNPIKL